MGHTEFEYQYCPTLAIYMGQTVLWEASVSLDLRRDGDWGNLTANALLFYTNLFTNTLYMGTKYILVYIFTSFTFGIISFNLAVNTFPQYTRYFKFDFEYFF